MAEGPWTFSKSFLFGFSPEPRAARAAGESQAVRAVFRKAGGTDSPGVED